MTNPNPPHPNTNRDPDTGLDSAPGRDTVAAVAAGVGVLDDPPVDRWRWHAARLVGSLVNAGLLPTPGWQTAVASIPRHRLGGGAIDPTERDLRRIYHDPALPGGADGADESGAATPGRDVPAVPPAVSPGVPPSVVAWVVEHLPRREDGEPLRVLEIGAGHGYLTGVLCAGLGDRQVVAVERDPGRAAATRAALAELGHRPEILAARPGKATARHGPFDAVIDIGRWAGRRLQRSGARVLAHDRAALRGQLAAGGRMIGAAPDLGELCGWGPYTLAVTDDRGGRPSRAAAVIDPQDLLRTARAAVDGLITSPGYRAGLLGAHVGDEHGRCRGCAVAGLVSLVPCPVHALAAAAAAATAAGPVAVAAGSPVTGSPVIGSGVVGL